VNVSVGPVSVLLAADHRVLREAVRALLDGKPSLRVVGEAADAAQAAELASQLLPDVLLVQLLVPVLAGIDLARRLKRSKLATRVVVLAAAADEASAAAAMANGVDGYVGGSASAADLVQAIHDAASGRRYLSPPFTEQQLERYTSRATHSGADLYGSLTARERQVLELAAQGLRNREIAERLGISPRTAESHRAKVMSKLGLRREADLVRFALRHGILPLERDAAEGD
jgi:DNA-binding NarL/FixJ family response regulator